MSREFDVVVVGAGIAGLTSAWFLKKQGASVLVLEAREHPGGNVRTVELPGGYRVESGPHSFMGSSEFIWKLIESAGLEDRTERAAAAADNRYIFRDERLTPLPLGAWKFLTSGLLSFKGKMRLAMEPFKRGGAQPDETAWDFFVRRFGEEAATYIMSPFISGVYAGDIHQLGARAAFGKFWNFENESGSMIRGAMKFMKAKKRRYKEEGRELKKGLYTLKGGLGGLTRFLADSLGEGIRYSTPVSEVSRVNDRFLVRVEGEEISARSVIVAVPPGKASQVLSGLSPKASGLLDSVPMVPVALVHWSVKAQPGFFPAGFGFLVPRVTGARVLGTLFPSQLFQHRAPEEAPLMASYYGGALDREAMSMSDEALKALVIEEHERILGKKLPPIELFQVMRVPHAIPQLIPGHTERIEELLATVRGIPGLSLAGNYLFGVGIENAVQSGTQAAQESASFLAEGRVE